MKNWLVLLLLAPMLAIGVACSEDEKDEPAPTNNNGGNNNGNNNNGGNNNSGPFCQDCVITTKISYSGPGTSGLPDSEGTTTGRYCDDQLSAVKAQEGRTTSSENGVTVVYDVDVDCN